MLGKRIECAWDEVTFRGCRRFTDWSVVMTTPWQWTPDPARTYEAFDRVRGERVWIKAFPADPEHKVIEYEYNTLRMLQSSGPHILCAHELFVGPYVAYSAERLDGATLRDCLGRPERDHARLRRLLAQLVRALDAVHRSGVVHRGVRPTNVFVTSSQRMVLFGFETSVLPRSDDSIFEAQTMAYAAPERDAPGDLFSVGMILFDALTGRWPPNWLFGAAGWAERHKPIPAPSALAPNVPEDLDRLCTALLDWDPARRPEPSTILSVLER